MNCDALKDSVDNTHVCKFPETEYYQRKITVVIAGRFAGTGQLWLLNVLGAYGSQCWI
jgi:hypothetical protein